MFRRRWVRVLLGVVLLTLVGAVVFLCSWLEPIPEVEVEMDVPEGARVLRIGRNTVWTEWSAEGALRVTPGNFMVEEYVDEEGETRRVYTAVLTRWIMDVPSTYEGSRVRPGDEVTLRHFRIQVLGTGAAEGTSYVKVAISEIGTPEGGE